MLVDQHEKKFNIASNDCGHMQKCGFSALGRNTLFGQIYSIKSVVTLS